MMTLMSSINVGFGGENKEGYHRGTKAMSFSALGAPIDVDNLYTKGNASVGYGIHAKTHHHEDGPEEHRDDSSYDIAGRALEVGTEGLSAWNNVDGLIKHYKYWTHSGPTEQDSRDIDKLLAKVLREDAEAEARERDRQTSSGRPSRASQMGDSDRDPRDGQRRGRTSTRHTDDQRSARSTVDDLNQAAYAPESDRAFIDRASDRARPQRSSSPTTFRNKERLNRAEANYEAAKDQGFIARSRASSELVEALQIYEARVDLRESLNAAAMLPSQTKDMVVDGIHYAKEHPAQAGARVAGIGLILASGGSATPFVGVGLGVAGGGLLGLASNDFRVENTQDVLNIGSSAVTGGFAPMRTLSALYGARNILSVAALTGVGIGGLGYSTGSTTMMVDGALLTGGAAISGGKPLFSGARSGKSWTHFPSPETPNIFANVANRNALNPVAALGRSSTNVSSMEAAIARRIAQPVANQNTALLFDVRNGTNGLSCTTRMSTEGSGIPRGFGVGRSEGVGVGSGGARSIPSGGGSSGPSQGFFIRRIDKSKAHAERMARGDFGTTTTVRERLFGTDKVFQVGGDRVRPINGKRPMNYDYAGSVYLDELPRDLQIKYPHGVPFTGGGNADFSRYATKKVSFSFSGDSRRDIRLANKLSGYKETPEDFTWHHHHDGRTMMLVDEKLHDAVRHTGGDAITRSTGAIK